MEIRHLPPRRQRRLAGGHPRASGPQTASTARAALFALALLAAFVRVVFAPGYMPQVTGDGSPLSLVICTPGGVTLLAHPGTNGSTVSVDPPCAFAALTTLAAAPDLQTAPVPRRLPRVEDRIAPPLRVAAVSASPLPLGARAPPTVA